MNTREIKELRELVAIHEARIRGEALTIVRASRAQAEHEYAVALAAVREGADIGVKRTTIQPAPSSRG